MRASDSWSLSPRYETPRILPVVLLATAVLTHSRSHSCGNVDVSLQLFSLEKSAPGQGLYRLAVLVALGTFVYWAYTQPTEFDEFVSAQKQFVADIYEGNLLADVAQEAKENIDKPVVPNLEDLLRELDEEMSEEERLEEEIIAQLMEEHEAEDLN